MVGARSGQLPVKAGFVDKVTIRPVINLAALDHCQLLKHWQGFNPRLALCQQGRLINLAVIDLDAAAVG